MSKVFWFLIGILVLVGLVVVYYFVPVGCDTLESQILEELEKVNYCESVNDCVVESRYGCPFGCYQYYNEDADLSVVDELVDSFEGRGCEMCVYSCLQAPSEGELGCVGGKCVDLRRG